MSCGPMYYSGLIRGQLFTAVIQPIGGNGEKGQDTLMYLNLGGGVTKCVIKMEIAKDGHAVIAYGHNEPFRADREVTGFPVYVDVES